MNGMSGAHPPAKAHARLRRLSSLLNSAVSSSAPAPAGATLTTRRLAAAVRCWSSPATAPAPTSAGSVPLSSAAVELYARQGFILVRNLLPAEDLDTICVHADAMAAEYPAFTARDAAARAEIEAAHAAAVQLRPPEEESKDEDRTTEILGPRHTRVGNRYYPLQRGPPGDSAERQALWAVRSHTANFD